ncbi:monovalent cation/H(+) antiporter subunit G [Labedella phragmitis]|uniref:Monovalent cation/H(+) antiporter subunit G n=1 Tax=Labedella phragmitis TaxID=2498849 RepID=A0A444PRP6_9MICO|nr:monovalent cation/H(+) antiporter subunit G [Labedella phragmitis]RWZ49892.1 monovalent cation/H(+) antiporter subunit G [Labedella phragmitis]
MSAEWSEAITATFIVVAAFLCAAAGIGLLRLPDVLSRLHAATKPQILGLGLIIVDVAVSNVSIATIAFAIAILFFQGLTAPISAHMVGRAAYRGDHVRRDLLVTDELADAVSRADERSGRGDSGDDSASDESPESR